MNTRIGVEPGTEGPLFVKKNTISYLDSHNMTGNVGIPTYEGGKTWNNDQFITTPTTKTNTPGPDTRILNTPGPDNKKTNIPGPSKGTVHDDDATIRGGCCGKKFDVFSGETSFHGLKHISGENNSSRRIAWIIILVLAFGGLSYQINLSVSKFFEYPTNTKLNYVTKCAISFPKVTVCNINLFRFHQVTAKMGGYTKFYEDGLNYLRSLAPETGITSNRPGNENGGYDKLTDETYPGDTNLQEFIRYNAHRIKDMLEVCIFNGIECGPENFTITYTNYGACYVFTPTTKSLLNNAGQKHGLSLILNVEHLQYVTAPRENVGFRIAIDCLHDAPNLEASGVDVGTGMRASIGLRKHTVSSLPYPHGSCIMEGDKLLKYFRNVSYTQSRCFLECETDYFMEACGCRTYYTPGYDSQPFCSPANLTGCYIPNYDNFTEHRVDICDCKEACFEEIFMKTNSFSGFPSRGVPQTLHVNNQYEYYALALGFNIKQSVSYETREISEEVVSRVDQFVADTFDELQLPDYVGEMPIEDQNRLLRDFSVVSYDLSFCIINTISDNFFYDFAYASNYTGVNSDFYNKTFGILKEDLSSQTDTMVKSFTQAVQKAFTSHNYTEEEAVIVMDVLLKNIFTYVYPKMREMCFAVAEHLYTTSDMGSLTHSYMQDNLARVDIYFESLNVEEIQEQKAYEFFAIICDLGGALGLFFGASIVAFVEAIDFWFIRGCCGCKKKIIE